MKNTNTDPREFKCFDDYDNDGWGNSIIERGLEDEESEIDDEYIPLENNLED